jgi:hypothetical protein
VSLTGTSSSTAADFSLSASPTSGTITAGQAATFTLNVTPSGGFNQAVNLTCGGAPPAATCMISPAAVTPNGSSAATATITLSTTARGTVGPWQRPRWIFPHDQLEVTKILWLILTITLLAGLLAGRRRRMRLTLGLAMLMVLLGVGCTGSVRSTTPIAGTPAGTYTLTLTGSSGTGSSALTHSINVSLAVN